jgi:hypothetical protein
MGEMAVRYRGVGEVAPERLNETEPSVILVKAARPSRRGTVPWVPHPNQAVAARASLSRWAASGWDRRTALARGAPGRAQNTSVNRSRLLRADMTAQVFDQASRTGGTRSICGSILVIFDEVSAEADGAAAQSL